MCSKMFLVPSMLATTNKYVPVHACAIWYTAVRHSSNMVCCCYNWLCIDSYCIHKEEILRLLSLE